ncbi:hypothetical protein ODU73_000766 [Thermoclostridium stercorarium]|jgi:hypothetical protein|uniref:hypothetical protein n=1 Tax=Thermoclostridium stercorarium TaxID=1510 RepID=UPI002248DACF|nr:hypothetical protein [Thermoclostridium stercorarium]UZQ86340.1 hypothetical protein ODU73_000766 [Thermoclostridium stercorarium]
MVQNKVQPFFIYFKKMMKFYDLKARGVPQVLFVLLLAVSFGLVLLVRPLVLDYTIYVQQVYNAYMDILSSENAEDPSLLFKKIMELQNSETFSQLMSSSVKIIGFSLLQQILLKLLSYFYLGAYLCDLEYERPSMSCYLRKFLKALPRFIGFNLFFYLGLVIVFIAVTFLFALITALVPVLYFAVNLVIFLIPVVWFIIQVIFIFKDITFLDTGVSIWRNFRLSAGLSSGNRFTIAKNIIFIVCLNLVIQMFSFESQLVTLFIVSFLEVIILLIKQRLIALMYLSRTRRTGENTPAEVSN